MSKNIFAEIKSEYEFLTRVEKKIADLLLKDPQTFITYSMTELSETAGISQGSINNFSKKFSSGGYAALKLKIAGCLSAHEEKPFTVIDKSQSIKDAMELTIAENTASFRNTLEINDETSLQSAVTKILQAKKIEIYGVFHSGIAAKDLCYQLIQLGIPATYVSDMLMCAVSASMLDSSSLAIAISSSGRTKEILDTVEIAKKNGVPIICLTSNKSSPLAAMADDVLLTAPSGTSISSRNNEIRMAQLFVIDALCSYIRCVIDAGGQNHYYKLQKIISSHNVYD